MNQFNHSKQFTAADFERYYTGRMTAVEMHALEKAALEDPFLADALEGYVRTATPVTDLDTLREKLEERTKRKAAPVVAFPNKTFWARFAAIGLLMAIAAYFIFKKEETGETTTLAKNEPPAVISQQEAAAPAVKDSIASLLPDVPAGKIIPNPARKEVLKSNSPYPLSADLVKNSPVAATDTGYSLQQKDMAYNTEVFNQPNAGNIFESKKSIHKPIAPQVITGKVTDRKGNVIPGAVITNNSNMANTNMDGKFNLPVTDSNTIASVSAVGYNTEKVQMDARKDQTIVLDEADQTLSEVVVTGVNANRNKQSQQAKAETVVSAKELAKAPVKPVSAPVLGWAHFQQYLQSNIKQPLNEKGELVKGMVVLSFSTNESGTPLKINVLQSLSPACDKEAIRLLQNGPKWTYAGKDKVRVEIAF